MKSWLIKRPWCWERLKAGGERDCRGWDGWIASPTWWTWDWANSKRWLSLACCSPWGHKESDTTERLNSNTAPSLPLPIILIRPSPSQTHTSVVLEKRMSQVYVMLISWVWGPTSGLISECQALDSSWVLSDSAGQMLVGKGHAGRGGLSGLVAATLEPSSVPQGPAHSLLGRAMAPWPSCPGRACTMEVCSWGTRNSLRERSREGKMSSYLFCFPRLTHCEH